ncbi:MAG: sugar ABC transporter ATP-binding protein [Clostridiales bacterium]|nr:sugar ABC transporter ATP-binding protein [Clostridiales bacterium]
MRAVFGVDAYDSGEIFLNGKSVKIRRVSDAIEEGIALVPENRKEEGLILINSVRYNMSLCILNEFFKHMLEDKAKEREICREYVKKLSIKTPSMEQTVKNLSGGNQQKVVLAKWIMKHPQVLILDEPTRGIDVGAKAEIYSIMNSLTEQGMGIIFISSELPEVINMSDRVMVMRNGCIAGEVSGEEITQENIMKYATGGLTNAEA